MDNGAMVFIIIIEAIVIVWLKSKLKQYEKFEQLLSAGGGSVASASGGASAEVAPVSAVVPNMANAAAAAAAVASSVSASQDAEEGLLDMPGVDPEDNIEEAKRVQLVMARCHYAEFYLEQLDDDYELGQFQRIINSCKGTARNIEDPFFRASALQPIVMLLHRAEQTVERDQLLDEVDDELVKQRITDELAA